MRPLIFIDEKVSFSHSCTLAVTAVTVSLSSPVNDNSKRKHSKSRPNLSEAEKHTQKSYTAGEGGGAYIAISFSCFLFGCFCIFDIYSYMPHINNVALKVRISMPAAGLGAEQEI